MSFLLNYPFKGTNMFMAYQREKQKTHFNCVCVFALNSTVELMIGKVTARKEGVYLHKTEVWLLIRSSPVTHQNPKSGQQMRRQDSSAQLPYTHICPTPHFSTFSVLLTTHLSSLIPTSHKLQPGCTFIKASKICVHLRVDKCR